MTTRLAELAHKRAQLIERASLQRAQISGLVRQCQGPLGVAEKGFAAVQFARRHPLLLVSIAGTGAYFLARRTGGFSKWGGRLLAIFQVVHGARSWWLKGRG